MARFTLLGATILAGPLQPARLGRMLDLEKSLPPLRGGKIRWRAA